MRPYSMKINETDSHSEFDTTDCVDEAFITKSRKIMHKINSDSIKWGKEQLFESSF